MRTTNACLVDDNELKVIYNRLHSNLMEIDEDSPLKPETAELRADIWLAAHSNVKKLFDLATTVAYYRLQRCFEHISNQGSVGECDEEEISFADDPLFVVIVKNIREYDGVMSLNDYFKAIVKEIYPDTLTNAEQKDLLDALKHVSESMDKANPRGTDTDEVKKMIYQAVHSGNKLLFNEATLLAYDIVKEHYKSMAKKYQDDYCAIEDFTGSTLYLTIQTNIMKYNGIYALQTYYEPFVKAAFTRERNASHGNQMTKHYIDNSVIVSRAEADLKSKGIEDATCAEVSDYIRIKYKKSVAEITVKRIRELSQGVDSIDNMTRPIADPYTMDPEKLCLEEERKRSFHKSLGNLTKRHQKVIEGILDYVETYGTMPNETQKQKLCMKLFKEMTKEDAKRLISSAFNEFKRSYRRYSIDELPLNNMRMVGDIQLMEIEEDDICNMFAECPDYFDEPADSEYANVVVPVNLDEDF